MMSHKASMTTASVQDIIIYSTIEMTVFMTHMKRNGGQRGRTGISVQLTVDVIENILV